MNESLSEEIPEIVDLDTCSRKKSVLIGAAFALVLSLVPYSYMFLCCHYAVAGFAGAGHFANRYQVTISPFQGAKLGALSAFVGMLVFYVAVPLWVLPSVTDEQWAEASEPFVQDAYERGQPEAAKMIESFMGADSVSTMLVVMFVVLFLASLALGSLGGVMGAVFLKKGPPAQ